jgi:hypothetical protein
MTQPRAAGPGPPTVALHRAPRALRPSRPPRVAAGVLLALLVVACGATSVSPSSPAVAGPSGPSAGASGGTLGPVAPTGSPGAGATGSLDPSQPRWPGTTVLAVIALGAADGEIEKAGADLQAAADAQDLRKMWGAADGLAKMIDSLIPNIDRLEIYDGTKPAATIYRKAFPELSAGAKQLRDAITNGDADGIVAGSQAIAQGLADYGPVRIVIGGLVEQAIVQQRLLLK